MRDRGHNDVPWALFIIILTIIAAVSVIWVFGTPG